MNKIFERRQKMLNFTINGKKANASPGTTILEAAKEMGIYIPTLCYHQELESYGGCRLCSVEVSKGNGTFITASCMYPVEEGIEVKTDTERIQHGRRMIMELLLARCPESKMIQEKATEFGVTSSRFSPKYEDCILCGLCVRVCEQVAGPTALSFINRGAEREVATPFDMHPDECLGCGACTYVCPTGLMAQEAKAVEEFRNHWGAQRWCRYMRMGFVPYKVCPNSYNCWSCEVDQRVEDASGTHPIFITKPAVAKASAKVADFELLPSLLYNPGHVWVKRLNGKMRIGIDDFAAKLICQVDDVAVACVGDTVDKGAIAIEVTSNGKKAKMLYPLSGNIVDINEDILDYPSLITNDPFNRGWIYDMKASNQDEELKQLMRINTAMKWMENEWDKLHQIVGEKKETIIADGGGLVSNLPSMLNQKEWQNIVDTFFLQK